MPYTSAIKLNNRHCTVMDPALYPEVQGRCNSYRNPTGVHPGVAYVLLSYSSAAEIYQDETFTLEFGDVSIGPLYWRHAIRLGTGPPGDPKSVYYVELYDKRALGRMAYRTDVIAHNLHSYATDLDYLTGTYANTGSSWQDVIDDAWPTDLFGVAPALLRDYQTAPHDIHFVAGNPWLELLPWIFQRLGLVLVYNPMTDTFDLRETGWEDAPTGIPQVGGLDATPEYDADAFHVSGLDVPEVFTGYSTNWRKNFGGEKDTEFDENWLVGGGGLPATDNVTTSHTEAIDNTQLGFCLDTRDEMDQDNIRSNTSERQNAAYEVIYGILNDNAFDPEMKIYTGYHPIKTSGRIKTVLWADFGGGSFTQYVQHSGAPSEEKLNKLTLFDTGLKRPDFPKLTYPSYPRVTQIVRCDEESPSVIGDTVEPNAEGVVPGFVQRHVGNTISVGDSYLDSPCWIYVLGTENGTVGGVDHAGSAVDGQRYIGRLIGVMDSEGEVRPLYAVQPVETQDVLCSALREVFNIPDELPDPNPGGVLGWIPRFNEADADEPCDNEELKQCPEAVSLQTVFDTFVEVPDASNYSSGDTIQVTDDGANNGTYLAIGTAGGAANSWYRTWADQLIAATAGIIDISGLSAQLVRRVLIAETGTVPIVGSNVTYHLSASAGTVPIVGVNTMTTLTAGTGAVPIVGSAHAARLQYPQDPT